MAVCPKKHGVTHPETPVVNITCFRSIQINTPFSHKFSRRTVWHQWRIQERDRGGTRIPMLSSSGVRKRSPALRSARHETLAIPTTNPFCELIIRDVPLKLHVWIHHCLALTRRHNLRWFQDSNHSTVSFNWLERRLTEQDHKCQLLNKPFVRKLLSESIGLRN